MMLFEFQIKIERGEEKAGNKERAPCGGIDYGLGLDGVQAEYQRGGGRKPRVPVLLLEKFCCKVYLSII